MSAELNTPAAIASVAPVLVPAESPPLRRFTVEQYHALAEAGVLTTYDRVELLDGLIVDMSPIGPPHAYCVEHVDKDILGSILPKGWHVRMQQPVTLPKSEPQPDIAVVTGKRRDYFKRHPGPSEIGLLIEVADTTLVFDRKKADIYAAAGIPQYWIINLEDRQVETYRQPRQNGKKTLAKYRSKQVIKENGVLTLRLQGKAIAKISASDLLP